MYVQGYIIWRMSAAAVALAVKLNSRGLGLVEIEARQN